MNILAEIRNRFRTALTDLVDDADPFVAMVRPAQDAKFGDFQANCAMPLAKQLGKNPREIAGEIVAKLDVADMCDEPEVAGPGFINLRLRDDWLQTQVNALRDDDRLGVPCADEPLMHIVDFSAPNVAKPMHVGHLRSTVIGAALRKVLQFLGHKVVGDNHIGDWGTQFGMIIYGYKNFHDPAAYANHPVQELARLYRLVNQLSDYHAARNSIAGLEERIGEKQSQLEQAESTVDPGDKKAKKALKKQRGELDDLKKSLQTALDKIDAVESSDTLHPLAAAHENIAEAARQETAKLHAGDTENNELWNEFLPHCLAMLQEIYDRLGVEFDETLGESFYHNMLAEVVSDLMEKGIAVESEGAICVFNDGFDAPFIIRKSDGAFTYATSDLATIKYRVEHFKADKLLYVVDARQSEHFEQLFATAKKWGYANLDCRHVKFGTILDPKTRTPYKTRAGDTVGLMGLLDEAHNQALAIVSSNDDAKPHGAELDADTRERVAETVGIGGVIYFDLNHNRESDYAFDFKKMLAKEGDTATYMQYAYARVYGIFRKGEIDRESLDGDIVLTHDAERGLALNLCRFAEAVHDVVDDFRPNILTQYLFSLANQFSTFFEQCHVLNAETDELRNSRLRLCDLTARVIEQGLSLLGISTCERM